MNLSESYYCYFEVPSMSVLSWFPNLVFIIYFES